jgi:membrane protease YdiL (CAAX protease family)
MAQPGSRVWYAAIAAAFVLIAVNLDSVIRLFGLQRIVEWTILLGLRNTAEVTVCLVGVAVAHRFGLRHSARELGLLAPIGRGLAFAAVASLPLLVTFAATSPINPKLSGLGVLVYCFVAPFAEEVVFRGYLFRQLYRRARLGFWLSALLPSAVFAGEHIYQAGDLSELLGIVAITGTGGLLFSWVFMKWQDNLWPVFGLHAAMNLWWEMFAIDDTALGSWVANGARLLTIVLAVLLTVYKDRIWKPLPVETANVLNVT